jgi:restriction endonuclease Mrr
MVQPPKSRFLGVLSLHNAVYDFFVTTSTFTPAAQQVIAHANGRIRAIDGHKLLWLLHNQSREVALALHEINS